MTWNCQGIYYNSLRVFANYGTVAITLSSLLSQATDNAKNPILNNINCTSETAPGIIWMIMTGADLNDIVTILPMI